MLMLDHLRCRCGHARMLHGGRNDRECRICTRVIRNVGRISGYQPCFRFHWHWLPGRV